MDQTGLFIIIIGLYIVGIMFIFIVVIDVYLRQKERKHKYKEWDQTNQTKGEFLREYKNFNQSLDSFERSIGRNQENFDKIVNSMIASLHKNLDGKIDHFDDSIKTSTQVTRNILQKNIEDFQQSISNIGNSFNDSIQHFKRTINHSERMADNFLNKLSYIKSEMFKSKAQGVLGEVLVKSSLRIILGDFTKGKIWFDPKEKAAYLNQFRQDLKHCGIEPDFLIQIARDSWIIIDSKTYLPGEKALIRIDQFEKDSILNKDQIQQAQEDINNWISLLVKSTSRMIKKGYLDSFKGPNFLWVVAPDRLVEYYLQKYSTIYLDEGILNNVVIPIKDTRAQLVSFSSLTWMLIELKSRGFKSIADADFHSNPEWYKNLKGIIDITQDVLEYNKEMMSKIVKTLDVLKEFKSDLINNEFSEKLGELEALTATFVQYFEALEDTSFNPRIAEFQFIPPRKTKGIHEAQINLDSFF
ncbi:MAG: DNA recombination protein RmuC [Promethearchaeota archaeon]